VEHRWGERTPLDVAVRINGGTSTVVRGRLQNVSLSGAFVRTSIRLPVWSQVQVELDLTRLRRSDRFRVPAYVVRATGEGVGLEWTDFAPRAVRALLGIARTRRTRASAHSNPRQTNPLRPDRPDRITVEAQPNLPVPVVAVVALAEPQASRSAA
jgi:hypothetical protein